MSETEPAVVGPRGLEELIADFIFDKPKERLWVVDDAKALATKAFALGGQQGRREEQAGAQMWQSACEQKSLEFQRETRRTSALFQMLHTMTETLIEQNHFPSAHSRGCELCRLVGEARQLMATPLEPLVNVSADPPSPRAGRPTEE